MREKDPTGVTALEEKHMIAMLVFLAANGPSRKIDIYDGVSSSNPRMPDKLNLLEDMGLVQQDMDPVTRATVVSLTESGDEVASLLLAVDKTIRSAPRT
ncbi:MAG: hypothetical protein A3208_04555 [Candidatus Methanoprimaticola hominis]|nr:MAG: hypothetical protein A3208_04555 [Methanomassiliicoccales archaeon Mx-06]